MSNSNLQQGQHAPNGNNTDGIKPEHHEYNNLKRYATNGSIAIPMDVFEKMYLNPEIRVKGELRRTFANPTPL